MAWGTKFFLCILFDIFDFTIGRLLIGLPIGEIIGIIFCIRMFGLGGALYGIEMIDPSEFVDGFVPTATLIALANRPA
jgi:hypothetical protein